MFAIVPHRHLGNCVDDLKRWLDRNHLLLNELKTEVIVFRSTTVRVSSIESTVDVCGAAVLLLPTIRDIGVIPDNRLVGSGVERLPTCLFSPVSYCQDRQMLEHRSRQTLVHSLVTSHIDYGKEVLYGISDRLLHRLEMVQHSAARLGATDWAW